MSKKFKKRFLIPCESHSSSEEKDDGLFTATDVIKEEVKKLENRLSDQDLLDIKRKTMARENWHESKKQVIECSEPLTKSIMSMRAMPVSKLLSTSPWSSTSSSMDPKEPKGTLDDDHLEMINFDEPKAVRAEQKNPIEEPKDELKDPKVLETKALKLFKQLSVELMNENPWSPLIKGLSVYPQSGKPKCCLVLFSIHPSFFLND